jgi:hypothetical protein
MFTKVIALNSGFFKLNYLDQPQALESSCLFSPVIPIESFRQLCGSLLKEAGILDLDIKIQHLLFNYPSGFIHSIANDWARTRRWIDPNEIMIKNFDAKQVSRLNALSDSLIYDEVKKIIYPPEKSGIFVKVKLYRGGHRYLGNDDLLKIEFLTNTFIGRRDCILAAHHVLRPTPGPDQEERFLGLHRKIDLGFKSRFSEVTPDRIQEIMKHQTVLEQPSFLDKYRSYGVSPTPCAGIILRNRDGRFFIHNPKDQNKKEFQGYSNKVYEFTRGRFDDFYKCISSDDICHVGLQQTAIREAFEECGLAADNLKYICDIEVDTYLVRYYLADVVGGDPRVWQRSPINETKSVVLTPLSRLKLLFSANTGGSCEVGVSDMAVLRHLLDFLEKKSVMQSPVDIPKEASKLEAATHIHSEKELLDPAALENKYRNYIQFSSRILDALYETILSDYSKRQAIINSEHIVHFDSVFGRKNASESLIQFVKFLRLTFTNVDPNRINQAVQEWVAKKLEAQFADGLLSTHFISPFEAGPNSTLRKFFDGRLDSEHRLPIVCTTYLQKDVLFNTYTQLKFDFANQRCVLWLSSTQPIANAFQNIHSSQYVGVFNHPDFQEAVKQISNEDQALYVVHKYLKGLEYSDYTFFTSPEQMAKSTGAFKSEEKLKSLGPLFGISSYKTNLDWNECLRLLGKGQIAGIGIDGTSLFDLEWAKNQQDFFWNTTGFRVPIFDLRYEELRFKSLSLISQETIEGFNLADHGLEIFQQIVDNPKILFELWTESISIPLLLGLSESAVTQKENLDACCAFLKLINDIMDFSTDINLEKRLQNELQPHQSRFKSLYLHGLIQWENHCKSALLPLDKIHDHYREMDITQLSQDDFLVLLNSDLIASYITDSVLRNWISLPENPIFLRKIEPFLMKNNSLMIKISECLACLIESLYPRDQNKTAALFVSVLAEQVIGESHFSPGTSESVIGTLIKWADLPVLQRIWKTLFLQDASEKIRYLKEIEPESLQGSIVSMNEEVGLYSSLCVLDVILNLLGIQLESYEYDNFLLDALHALSSVMREKFSRCQFFKSRLSEWINPNSASSQVITQDKNKIIEDFSKLVEGSDLSLNVSNHQNQFLKQKLIDYIIDHRHQHQFQQFFIYGSHQLCDGKFLCSEIVFQGLRESIEWFKKENEELVTVYEAPSPLAPGMSQRWQVVYEVQ